MTLARMRLPWILLAITVLLVAVMLALSLGREPLFDTVFFALIALALGTMGAFISSQHRTHPIGWIFCGMAIWSGVTETWEAFAYHSLPTSDAGSWLIGWSWIVDMAAYVVVLLLFPTGRLLTRRWRFVLWMVVATCVLGIPGQAFNADNPDNPWVVESTAVQVAFGLGMTLLLAAMGAAVLSVVIRYRRAAGVERLQLKQLVFAGAFLLPSSLIAIPFYYDSILVEAGISLAFLGLPIAVGLAILRYRLYDIDVVINRALVYGALTATLAAVYVGTVLLFQLVLSGLIEGSSLAVAASTLAVAGAFGPARSRIQAAVDRRFFRRRYDAARTLEAFGARLRDEIDLDSLDGELRAVVAGAMQPAHVSLWLRDERGT